MVNVDLIRGMGLEKLGRFYAEVLKENDEAMIRSLILADRFFLMTMVLDVKVAWHPWVLERCREVEADPDEHLDLWSRGHFKSTIITYAGVAQYVLGHPEHSVCIISYKAGAAESFAGQIKQAFERNATLNRCFPDVLWGEELKEAPQWSVSDWTVRRKTGRKEASVATSGLVSGMRTGGHYDLLVYDDTVTPESVTNPEQIQRTTDAWSMSLNLGTIGSTKHWYIGTRYAMFDTYHEMLKTGTIRERRHVCVDERGEPVLLPKAEFEKKRAEMSTKDWASQMMQTPVGEGELLMKEEWFHTYDRVPDIAMNVYIIADTAQKLGKGNDWTVFWVVGLGRDGRYYVLDGVRDKLKQSDRCSKLFALVEKWQPACVFYEENAAPDDVDYFTEQMERFGRFDIKAFRQKPSDGSKKTRIETLEPAFRAGLVWFPQTLKYRQFDGRWVDIVDSFLREEFLVYPSVSHDDMLDALSGLTAGNDGVKPYLAFPTMRARSDMGEVDREILYGKANRGRSDVLFGR